MDSDPNPDATLQARLQRETRFVEFQHRESCPSTQDLAAAAGSGACVWADRQTAGRGRSGRDWSSGGAVDVEVSFRIPTGGLAAPELAAVVLPAAVAEALCEVGGVETELKWPNDVMLGGRKLCGILIDAQGPRAEVLLVGCGVNVGRTSFPGELQDLSTSFALATGRAPSRHDVVLALGRALEWATTALTDGKVDAWVERFRLRTGFVGRTVRLECVGGERIEDVVEALDQHRVVLGSGRQIPLVSIERARICR